MATPSETKPAQGDGNPLGKDNSWQINRRNSARESAAFRKLSPTSIGNLFGEKSLTGVIADINSEIFEEKNI